MSDLANITENDCLYPSAVVVHWPGQSTPCCLEHAEKLLALADAMGSPRPAVTPIDGLKACTNCVNEGARHE